MAIVRADISSEGFRKFLLSDVGWGYNPYTPEPDEKEERARLLAKFVETSREIDADFWDFPETFEGEIHSGVDHYQNGFSLSAYVDGKVYLIVRPERWLDLRIVKPSSP